MLIEEQSRDPSSRDKSPKPLESQEYLEEPHEYGNCINIHIGQAGIRLGDKINQQYCFEHSISPDGSINKPLLPDYIYNGNSPPPSVFFNSIKNGSFMPRSIFVDSEPTEIDTIRTGPTRGLYTPKNLISGIEDSSSTYARGYYTVSKPLIGATFNQVRKLAEATDKLQGFIFTNSYGGGTGSGFSSFLLDNLCVEYQKNTKFQFSIFPSECLSVAVVEPYNAVLSIHDFLQTVDLSFLFDNLALSSISKKEIHVAKPDFTTVNGLLSYTIANITSTLRFDGCLNTNLNEFLLNLVPTPRIHFPVVATAPLMSRLSPYKQISVSTITNKCFSAMNHMLSCPKGLRRYMASCLHYYGDITVNDISRALQAIKDLDGIQFASWCPVGYKIGVLKKTVTIDPDSDLVPPNRAVCGISNTTGIRENFADMLFKFDLLYRKKAFVHWYLEEGLEEQQFQEARENVQTLLTDYETIEKI